VTQSRKDNSKDEPPRRETGAALSSALAARPIDVTVNGEVISVDEGATVADLLVRLRLASQAVAVEVNLDLVPRARHAEVRLAAGDRVEIVTLVGGG
jgi:sulfur carrier protein